MTNIIVASVYVVVSIWNVLGESWVYYSGFAAAVEVGLLAFVMRCAWTWPRTEPQR